MNHRNEGLDQPSMLVNGSAGAIVRATPAMAAIGIDSSLFGLRHLRDERHGAKAQHGIAEAAGTKRS